VFIDRSGDAGEASTDSTAADTQFNTGESVLFVASAHSRKVPNNEHLDPPADRASIISEVGSHSSTLGVNAERTTFQRTDLGELAADISNDPVEVVSGEASFPLAYGLPRDEGLTLPYAVPEHDGDPLHEHDRLPNLRPGDLLPDDITVGTYDELANPPAGIPKREGEITFVPAARAGASGDTEYALVDIDDVSHIDDFTGPQLSFSFTVPQFAEDAFADHLSTPGVPWQQERFEAPTADISEPQHRAALAERYDPVDAGGSASRILGAVREASGADDAPGSNGVELLVPSVETVALLESDPEAVPSFSGVLTVEDPPEGEHRLTVNGAGMAPYSEKLAHEGGTTRAGVEGAIPMSPNEDAVKVQGESADAGEFERVTLDDDFAGTLYDGAPPGENGQFGVYAHRDGAYTTAVEDQNGQRGARRVNPNAEDTELALPAIETGKSALADYLVRFLTETHGQTAVFENGNANGIDNVPTGQDVSDDVVGSAATAAAENAGGLVENASDIAKRVVGGKKGNGDPSDTETATPTETAVDDDDTETEAIGNSNNDDDQPRGPGKGFTGVLTAIDAALLVAVAARDAETVEETDRRLEELRDRLETVQTTVEESETLPPGLGKLATRRIDRMLPRVEAALDAEA